MSQLLSIYGKPPLLIEVQKCWQSSTNIEGEQGFPLKVFFFTCLNIFIFSSLISSINLGLRSESRTFAMFWSFASSSTGLIRVKQSLSLKKLVSSFRMLFFLIARSDVPFWGFKAFYKYSWGEITIPFSSTNLSAKSLTSHRKLGKH